MNNDKLDNWLDEIAKQIRSKTDGIKTNIFEVGEMLTNVKQKIPHGKFKKWVTANCDFSYQSANNFMNLYGACLGNPGVVKEIRSTILYKITAPKFPEELRSFLLNHPLCLKNIKAAELESFLKEHKGEEIDLNNQFVRKLLGRFKSRESWKKYENSVRNTISQIREINEVLKSEAKKVKWPVLPHRSSTGMPPKTAETISQVIRDMKSLIESIEPKIEIIDPKLLRPYIKK